MRRRDVVAGIVGVGALGSAGFTAVYGLPTSSEGEDRRHEPIDLETVAATGSDAGTVTVPTESGVTFVDLFATTCDVCREQMPTLGELHDRYGEEMTFVSVTNERAQFVDDDALAAWWDDHDGRWTLARDPTSELIVHYGTSTPTAVLFDSAGNVVWEDTGRKSLEEFEANVRPVLERERA